MKHQSFCRIVTALGLCLTASGVAQADILTFDFTGRLTIVGSGDLDTVVIAYQPISASLSYDTASGLGSSGLSITTDTMLFGSPLEFHDISMTHLAGTNLINGQVLVNWSSNLNMPFHVQWDATGLFKAINYGLQVGDKLSGTNLYRDTNGDRVWEASEWMADIGSATPYTDSLLQNELQGPAPLATTSGSLGITDPNSPFSGIIGYFDIGSGNSMYVTSVTAVPVPAAVWLFGSGLLGFLAMARKGRS